MASGLRVGPSGIGGWLYLVAIGLCVTPIRIAAELVKGVGPLDPATWHAVTTPGMRAYHPLFGPLIVGELVLNAVLLLWALALLYLFFAKRRSFPVAMIAFMIVRTVGQVADLGVALTIPATAARIGPAVYGSVAGSILVAVIWAPYLVRSRRVKATFVR
jgi:hypothetical protein